VHGLFTERSRLALISDDGRLHAEFFHVQATKS
jgi:hypothetical protein